MAAGLRITPSRALREKRLAALLQGRSSPAVGLEEAVAEEQARGSLELAGRAPGADEMTVLLQARRAVDPRAPLGVDALLAWHAAASGSAAGLRTRERTREDGPPPAPAAFVAGRLQILEQWLGSDSARQLGAAQQGALAMARILEILPFESANGRVARLASSHLMVQAGGRPPILVGADAPRLGPALLAAFDLRTEALTALLEEASDRALELMIRRLEGGADSSP